ncbi:hypothetical protein PFX98_02885 [Paucibacter sediminis]|uniref:Mannosylglycerate hydrolase MGH1-like glycoside hydrolase domain-containing protein n=1 Tax=Paucibacter sediminis TaxID=3019553 RepID=A0AA95NHU1_9BURK|nr:hypothetical protein [Paucibacter sp. S2-9]WIT12569.1 hypothetical protein PFX98_02885 [Paucibacter sp. S2-9]
MSATAVNLFDPQRVPFSRRESWFSVSWLAEDQSFWLRHLRGGDEHTDLGRLFRLQPVDAEGQALQGIWSLQPDQLSFHAEGGGSLQFAWADADTLALQGQGIVLQLTLQSKRYDYAQRLSEGTVHVSCAGQDLSARVALAQGELRLDAPWQGQRAERIALELRPDAQGAWAASVHLYRVQPAREDVAGFEAARAASEADFQAWLAQTLPLPQDLTPLRRLAAYITWSCLVPAEGVLRYPAMYMSKNWMTNIWSWDHCFNALALGAGQPERAWQQLAVLFELQHEKSGRLPDFANDLQAYWRFTKPPVHGWTVAQLRRQSPWSPARCAQMHDWLAAQARSWLATAAEGGLPAYDHGNDAGWDNATTFLEGTPLQSPDLSSFLVLQLEELAALAELLGRPAEALDWRRQADALFERLLAQLWTGERFVARLADGRVVEGGGDSLIAYIPLLLGQRLPAAMRERLLAELFEPGRFLSPHGLATESQRSPHYRADGYWRGPIWAPTTLLFVDAMDRCGRPDLGDELARRYTTMCASSGLAENYDAQTGAPLRDPAFTWTSSVALLLGHRLYSKKAAP